MRVAVSWLRDWVDIQESADVLAERLTMAGLEVDEVLLAAPPFSGVVVGEVLETEPHPNADRLTVCKVTTGAGVESIVCGAPNVRAGLKVAVAEPGATLPGGMKIRATQLRGVASNGMICSGKELGLPDDHDGIIELPMDAPIATPLRDYLDLDDILIEVALTPNRGDCFSMVGVARELAVALNQTFNDPSPTEVAATQDDRYGVHLDAPDACPRFVSRTIRGVNPGSESPPWLRERLRRVGLRPIHPVVDVTNYVMMETGQPLHAYDLNKLQGDISVRMGRDETLTLLDGREISLDADVLAITDEQGPIALAGVMGGASTAVDDTTVDVLLEVAWFHPDAIAGRARRFGLHTDASLRFERGVDPEGQVRVMERATQLLLEIAGGEPGPLVNTEAPTQLPKREAVSLRHQRLERILGTSVPPDQVISTLEALGMTVQQQGDAYVVVAPGFRFDIAIEEDLIEEIARIIGYDNIPSTPGAGAANVAAVTETRVPSDAAGDVLVARGYREIITYAFIDATADAVFADSEENILLANPISADLAAMRRSLLPGLLKTAQENIARQQSRLRLFEVGNCFLKMADGIKQIGVLAGFASGPRLPEHWDDTAQATDLFDIKADIEAILALTGRTDELAFQPANREGLSPGRTARIHLGDRPIGWLGALHPATASRWDLDDAAIVFELDLQEAFSAEIPKYSGFSKFPSVRRDIALLVDESVAAGALVAAAQRAGGALLREVLVFDLYRGSNIDSSRKSIALGLILQDTSRTLIDEDADTALAEIVSHLETELGATIRK
jgi:phenylalanyl-tRNA synthetase beta chain